MASSSSSSLATPRLEADTVFLPRTLDPWLGPPGTGQSGVRWFPLSLMCSWPLNGSSSHPAISRPPWNPRNDVRNNSDFSFLKETLPPSSINPESELKSPEWRCTRRRSPLCCTRAWTGPVCWTSCSWCRESPGRRWRSACWEEACRCPKPPTDLRFARDPETFESKYGDIIVNWLLNQQSSGRSDLTVKEIASCGPRLDLKSKSFNLKCFSCTLPDGMTTSAPSLGAVKLFSAEFSQKEASDHRLEKQKQAESGGSNQRQVTRTSLRISVINVHEVVGPAAG